MTFSLICCQQDLPPTAELDILDGVLTHFRWIVQQKASLLKRRHKQGMGAELERKEFVLVQCDASNLQSFLKKMKQPRPVRKFILVPFISALYLKVIAQKCCKRVRDMVAKVTLANFRSRLGLRCVYFSGFNLQLGPAPPDVSSSVAPSYGGATGNPRASFRQLLHQFL